MKKLLCMAVCLLCVSIGLDAQVLSHRITKATKTTIAADGVKTVEDYPLTFVDIDQNSKTIFLNLKKSKDITLTYETFQTIVSSPISQRLLYLNFGKNVCDRTVTLSSNECEMTIYLDENTFLTVSGKYLENKYEN